MDCKYCTCIVCKWYEECEPCRGDYDYEHPCEGVCDEFEQQESEDKE